MNHFHFTRVSRNRKTGPIPVTTTDASSCPPLCPFNNGGGCYAESGPLALHWRKVSDGTRAITLEQLDGCIRSLPRGQLWRHDQAGDLPGIGDNIDAAALATIVSANRKKRGFTYTHKPLTPDNLAAIKDANANGFTINLSANNASDADRLAVHGLPVVALIPDDAPKVSYTPKGQKIVHCPAENSERISCSNCGLCAQQGRPYIIGFKPKGGRKKKVNLIAKESTT